MKIDWQQNKLTIVGFGIIFVILGVFGYILWDMNREPLAEVVMEPTPITTKIEPKVDSTPVIPAKEELPEYPITKVDTTGWESKEFKVGDVGIRYKSPSFDNNLIKYGLSKESYLFSWDEKSKQDLESDYLLSINPFGKSGTGVSYWIQPIKITFVESSSLSNQNIYDVFAKQTCKYDVVEVPENERYYDQKYKIVPKCNTKEQVVGSVYKPIADINQEATRIRQIKRLDEVVSLCSGDSEIVEYNNPFIDENNTTSSSLIKCKVVSGADNNKNVRYNNRELFILSLANNSYAVIEYQNTGIPGDNGIDSVKTEAANNLMHTILSTIEVL
ncbi:MAG: hypothetical protein ACO3TG_03105 [Minisyncoccia bacterium]